MALTRPPKKIEKPINKSAKNPKETKASPSSSLKKNKIKKKDTLDGKEKGLVTGVSLVIFGAFTFCTLMIMLMTSLAKTL